MDGCDRDGVLSILYLRNNFDVIDVIRVIWS